ncbi:WD40 repeat-like protein [Suillus decipiens]|nr:WD40 repeat-like protein [Suillus decipiens]
MSRPISKKQHMVTATPCQTMRGHTSLISGVAHLHDGRRIITCSKDGSLRLWDLQKGTQIGDDWRDENDDDDEWEYEYEEDEMYELGSSMWAMALSPSGDTVASGSYDGTVRLWDVETPGKVITKWTGHREHVRSVCWSLDGKRVAVGTADGIARIWDVGNGKTVLGPMETGHESVTVVVYSPDSKKFATGGYHDIAIRIRNAKTGEVIFTYEPEQERDEVFSLIWTSNGKKLISGLHYGSIRIFDTATWQQIAFLEDPIERNPIYALSLFPNERLLASTSWDETVHLWDLDTNLPVGPTLQHEEAVSYASLSADGKLLVTGGCHDGNAYVWDIHAILREAGLKDILSVILKDKGVAGKLLMNTDATRRPARLNIAHSLPQGFFDDAHDGLHSSTMRGTRTHSSGRRTVSPFTWSPRALFGRLSSPFRRSENDGEATELHQRQKRSIFSRRSPAVKVPAVRDKQALFVAPRPKKDRAQQQQPHRPAQASTSQTQPSSTSAGPPAPDTNTTTPGTPTVKSRILSVLAHLVLFVCCASTQYTNSRQ